MQNHFLRVLPMVVVRKGHGHYFTTVLPFSQSVEMGNLSTIPLSIPLRLPTGKGLEFLLFCKDPE